MLLTAIATNRPASGNDATGPRSRTVPQLPTITRIKRMDLLQVAQCAHVVIEEHHAGTVGRL
eukprot:1324508-Amphidinium_carterae.1